MTTVTPTKVVTPDVDEDQIVIDKTYKTFFGVTVGTPSITSVGQFVSLGFKEIFRIIVTIPDGAAITGTAVDLKMTISIVGHINRFKAGPVGGPYVQFLEIGPPGPPGIANFDFDFDAGVFTSAGTPQPVYVSQEEGTTVEYIVDMKFIEIGAIGERIITMTSGLR